MTDAPSKFPCGSTPPRKLDDQSRRHIGIMLRQVVLVALICLPMAMVGEAPLKDYFHLMRIAFGFSALAVTVTAKLSGARLSATSLGVWDHGAALLLLNLGCSLVLVRLT